MSNLNQDQNSEMLCWHCTKATEALVCNQCGKIQPPMNKDYYALIGVPVSFGVDLVYLEKKYLQLQKQIHPDLFVDKSMRERRYASQQSSMANQAYEVLKDPVQRGHYLLKIMDKDYQENQSSTFRDQEFLMTLMMEQEAIENVPIPPEAAQAPEL